MGLFELAAFFVGTGVVSYAAFLFGRHEGAARLEGFIQGKNTRSFWQSFGFNTGAEGFDDKVDIVCNACGLVAEVECAACGTPE